ELALANEVSLSVMLVVGADVEAVSQARGQRELGERGTDHLIGPPRVILHAQLTHGVRAVRRDRVAAEGKPTGRGAVVHGDGRGKADDVDQGEAVQVLTPRARQRQVLAQGQPAALQLRVDPKVVALEARLDDGAVLL